VRKFHSVIRGNFIALGWLLATLSGPGAAPNATMNTVQIDPGAGAPIQRQTTVVVNGLKTFLPLID
jgi:hypothetical protein